MIDIAPMGGFADPEGESVWAMQIVTRWAKSDLPSRSAVCEASALGVVRLLDDERASGVWAPLIERWCDGRIRKHSRRTSGGRWDRVAGLDGVLVSHRGALVKVLVPGPVDMMDADVSKCQLSGSEPDNSFAVVAAQAPVGGRVVISIQPEPFLPLGKAAAAAGHAAQLALKAMDSVRAQVWRESGFDLVVCQPDPAGFRAAMSTAQVVVRDGGFTVVAPGTVTATAFWN